MGRKEEGCAVGLWGGVDQGVDMCLTPHVHPLPAHAHAPPPTPDAHKPHARAPCVCCLQVLAHAYVREDHVMDQDLPLWVPLPPIAEVQTALEGAVSSVLQPQGVDLKSAMRTGTLVTTGEGKGGFRGVCGGGEQGGDGSVSVRGLLAGMF